MSGNVLALAGRGSGAVRVGRWSIRGAVRSVVVCAALAVAVLVAAGASLRYSQFEISWADTVRTVVGQGDPAQELVIGRLYLPRVVTGVLVGAALAMSGAIFQTLSRNPLGSPDIIGFTTGSSTGALVVLLVVGGGPVATSLGAAAGGLLTALAVVLLSWGRGVHGFRLVLIGIGIGSLLLSVNWYLITRSTLYDAQSAAVWLVGSLVGGEWSAIRVLAAAVFVLGTASLLLSRSLQLTELGDEAARSLAVPLDRIRLAALFLGVGLAGAAVAVAGPIAFVALAAPQIARRLTRAAGPNLLASALTGALVLVVADHGARELFLPRQLPVGVMTGVVGGLYLAWLLGSEWKRGRA